MKEWENEEDFYEFELNGFQCEIIRHKSLRHLCGYVYLEQDHPYYGKDYDSINVDVDVHGGLTYSAMTEKGFKIGFDCAHWNDLVPGPIETQHLGLASFSNGIYRNVEFVKYELSELTKQLVQQPDNLVY